jgi:hypothetical protein
MRHRWLLATVVMIGVLAAQGSALTAVAQNHGGRVSGHTEGMPPIDGELCVHYTHTSGPRTECKSFMSGGYYDIAISIPEASVPSASFTVRVGNGIGPSGYWPTVDSLTNTPCGPTNPSVPNVGMPLTAPAGMALCQSTDPAYSGQNQIHRFNTTWNTNSSGNGSPGRCVGPQPGTQC